MQQCKFAQILMYRADTFGRNYVSVHTLTDEKVLIPSPNSPRRTIFPWTYCRAAKLSFLQDTCCLMYSTGSKTYLPRRLRAIFHNASVYTPSGGEALVTSPWNQNKDDDRTTLPFSFLSLSPSLSLPFFHSRAVSIALTSSRRIVTRMQICSLDR